MKDNFFKHICSDYNNATEVASLTEYLSLERCKCKGRDYSGMPSFDILFKESDDDSPLRYYEFEP